jgi:phosphatidate cytidylyltransferase
MAHHASEYDDDRSADDDRAARPVRHTRPAWDALTYGRPDDRRRPLPPSSASGRTSETSQRPPLYSEDAYRSSSDLYQAGYADTYIPPLESTFESDSYTESYPSNSYEAPSYESSYEPTWTTLPDSYSYESAPEPAEPVHYPGGLDEDVNVAPAPSNGRAGRNLPAAIGVGVALGAVILASLFLWRPAFLGVVAVAVGIGIWEMVRAIRISGVNPPLIPLVAGGALMTGLAWWGHADALTFGLVITVLAAMVWRLADGAGGYGRDVTAATLVAVYVPFLAGFAALLASAPSDGDLRVLVTLAAVVLSDTGGYVAGVLFGRHPMAPSVSPKKSWEGLGGSLIATAIGGAILLNLLFHVSLAWGAVFGIAVSAAAVVGDLGESMMKRDLGVKDMSNLLPGHGGLMDRLDSIVFAAPTSYILLIILAPPL